jgi:hypothetical protein
VIVKCYIPDCIYNEHCKCEAGTIEIHPTIVEGVCKPECYTMAEKPEEEQ